MLVSACLMRVGAYKQKQYIKMQNFLSDAPGGTHLNVGPGLHNMVSCGQVLVHCSIPSSSWLTSNLTSANCCLIRILWLFVSCFAEELSSITAQMSAPRTASWLIRYAQCFARCQRNFRTGACCCQDRSVHRLLPYG